MRDLPSVNRTHDQLITSVIPLQSIALPTELLADSTLSID